MTPAPALKTQEVARWLVSATENATGSRIVIDHSAEYPCSVDPDRRIICLRAGLNTEELLHVLPRAALVLIFPGSCDDLDDINPFPLRLVERDAG